MDGEYHVVESDESRAARYMNGHLPEGREIWVMDDHIIYWLLSMEPPSKYLIHPSKVAKGDEISISSDNRATTASVVKDVFAQRPYFIVRQNNNWYIRQETPEGDLINATMGQQYEKVAQFGRLGVFRRKDG
jgi:hypothetical protein